MLPCLQTLGISSNSRAPVPANSNTESKSVRAVDHVFAIRRQGDT